MKLKSLLYGSAAVLVSTGATNVALAADPPLAAEPVEYVRVCDAFGKGFFYIPGTDTCLKIDGYVRIEARFSESDGDDDKDTYETRARARIRFDARNETDLGLLRSMISFYQTLGPGGNSPSGYDLTYSSPVTLDDAFITLSNDMGQLTVGKTASFFDFFGGYTMTGAGGYDQTTDQTMFAYTFNIGNGVSATLALEDPYSSGRKLTEPFGSNAHGAGPNGSYHDEGHKAFGTIYGGQRIGDLVANLRVDQGWGSAQIMGVLRQIRQKDGSDFSFSTITGFDFTGFGFGTGETVNNAFGTNTFISNVDQGDEWGWAVGAGLEVDIPGVPVSLALQGGYSEGAGAYVAAAPEILVDAIYNGSTGDIDLTEVWQINAGVSIAASPTVSINIDGAYGDVDHSGDHFDYEYWGVAGNVVWKPVSGLAIVGELQYKETEVGSDSELSDSDTLSGVLRFQRSF